MGSLTGSVTLGILHLSELEPPPLIILDKNTDLIGLLRNAHKLMSVKHAARPFLLFSF